jgi:diaminobutyrate-2-oxoglutarate transaminase
MSKPTSAFRDESGVQLFERLESNVRSYCRAFPAVFARAQGAYLYDESGRPFLDFFAGAGALNYGHNHPAIKQRVVEYLMGDNVLHALDMYTVAKRNFLESFENHVLSPRRLDYKIQFCAPTGTNAVEAALKIARKVKGRTNVLAFQGGYHGMSLGALAVTANREARAAAGLPMGQSVFFRYPAAHNWRDSLEQLETLLTDSHSGLDLPAAVILETVQAEGGVNVAPGEWLRGLRALCDRHDLLLIVDDIQVGCHRTGPFFSFEDAGVVPDIVTLSKSISGLGLPMAIVLLKPQLDIWQPGEHTGTFRGNQLAFVAAAAALDVAAAVPLERAVRDKAAAVEDILRAGAARLSDRIQIRGRGLIWGVDVSGLGGDDLIRRISSECFRNGLIIERAGRGDSVFKLLPPLTIETEDLERGCSILLSAIEKCAATA